MGDNTNKDLKSRRWFLSLFSAPEKKTEKPEMVKMLTPDGKLVEIERSILEKASTKQRSSNKDIYDWMQNPSKNNNS